MNLKKLNESFSNKYSKSKAIDESFKGLLKSKLNERLDKLSLTGCTNIATIEKALQEELQRITNKDWWEVTEVNIFGNLFESRDPHKTVDDIVENLKEGIDDDLEFVDNRKASIIYNDPELDPGFDEYDVKEKTTNEDLEDDYTVEYYLNTACRERRPETINDVENDYTVETFYADNDYDAAVYTLALVNGYDEDEVKEDYPDLDSIIDEFNNADWGDGGKFVVKLSSKDNILFDSGHNKQSFLSDIEDQDKFLDDVYSKINAYNDNPNDDELEESKKKRSKLLDKVNRALSEADESKSIKEDLEEDDYFDLESDIYHRLSDIMFKYKHKDISEKDIDNAFEHFKMRFFEDNNDESLNEARNKDNLEINEKIALALRSKSKARKYEKELNDLGIRVDFLNGQGTMLTGPNGRSLSASKTTIFGPSRPEFNGTHYKGYIPNTYYEEKYLKRAQDRLDELQSLVDKADANILRVAYPGLSFEEATEKLTADFEEAKDDVKKYTDSLNRERVSRDRSLRNMHARREAGHSNPWIHDTEIEASVKESPIDFLTYLTKEKSALRTHKYPDERTPKIAKYHDLNDTIKRAESSLNWDKEYHKVLDQDQLQAKLDELEAEFEAKVQQLLKQQDRNKSEIRNSYDRVDKAKKDKSDYLKSLGIGN